MDDASPTIAAAGAGAAAVAAAAAIVAASRCRRAEKCGGSSGPSSASVAPHMRVRHLNRLCPKVEVFVVSFARAHVCDVAGM